VNQGPIILLVPRQIHFDRGVMEKSDAPRDPRRHIERNPTYDGLWYTNSALSISVCENRAELQEIGLDQTFIGNFQFHCTLEK
jgi:hypothetical protein